MGYRRRSVLGLLGACAGLGAVGSAQKEEKRPQPAASDVADQPEATSSDVASQQEPTDDSEESTNGEGTPSELAGRTEDVLDELGWFAGEYDDAIADVQDSADAVLTAISEHGETIQLSDTVVERLDGEVDQPRLDRGWPYDVLWDKGERRWRYVDIDWQQPTDEVTDKRPLSPDAISELRTETTAFADTFESEVSPRFYGADRHRSFAKNTIDTIAEFNEQGDIVMAVAGLVRLYQYYQALDSPKYVDSVLSKHPIRNRLADILRSDVRFNTPALFEVDYRSRGGDQYQGFVYDDSVSESRRNELNDGEPLATIDGSTGKSGGLRLHDVVSALAVETGRIDRCYILVNEWQRPSENYYTEALPSAPIFVQRYETAPRASDVLETLLGRAAITPASSDTVKLGDSGSTGWVPVNFPYRGQPWRAALRQSGRNLLVVGASRRPFNHRTPDVIDEDWNRQLVFSWIWSLSE